MVPVGQGGHPDRAGSGAAGSSTRGRVSSAAPVRRAMEPDQLDGRVPTHKGSPQC